MQKQRRAKLNGDTGGARGASGRPGFRVNEATLETELELASAGLLALLDDIATVLDDVAVMAKLATKKTAAIAGDDLAVGAQAMVGLHPSRELPIVWAVAKGSLINKAWLVPLALVLTLLAPFILTPLLMIGGAFLCYEGVHKSLEKLGFGHHLQHGGEEAGPPVDAATLEKQRVAGAIRTDVILSAEIVVIALSAMESSPFVTKVITLSLVAVALTIVIYGLIALIVKADDAGLHLVEQGGPKKALGKAILVTMPPFMKLLGLFGTIAMFLVGGEIVAHGIPPLEHGMHDLIAGIAGDGALATILGKLAIIAVGVAVGFFVIGLVKVFGKPVSAAWAKVRARFKRST